MHRSRLVLVFALVASLGLAFLPRPLVRAQEGSFERMGPHNLPLECRRYTDSSPDDGRFQVHLAVDLGFRGTDEVITWDEYYYVWTSSDEVPRAQFRQHFWDPLVSEPLEGWYRVDDGESYTFHTEFLYAGDDEVLTVDICWFNFNNLPPPSSTPFEDWTPLPTLTAPPVTASPTPGPSNTTGPTSTSVGTVAAPVATPNNTNCRDYNGELVTRSLAGGGVEQVYWVVWPEPWPSAQTNVDGTYSQPIWAIGVAQVTTVWVRIKSRIATDAIQVKYFSTPGLFTGGAADGTITLSTATYSMLPDVYAFGIRQQSGATLRSFTVEVCLGDPIEDLFPDTTATGTRVPTQNWEGFPTYPPAPAPDNCRGNGGPASSSCLQRTQVAQLATIIALMQQASATVGSSPTVTATPGGPTATDGPSPTLGPTGTAGPTQDLGPQLTSVSIQQTSLSIQMTSVASRPSLTSIPVEMATVGTAVVVDADLMETAIAAVCEREPCHSVDNALEILDQVGAVFEGTGDPAPGCLPLPGALDPAETNIEEGIIEIDAQSGWCTFLEWTYDGRMVMRNISSALFIIAMLAYTIRQARRFGDV